MARQCTVEQYGAPRICFAVHTGIPLRSLKVSSGLGNMPGRGGLAMSNSDACGFFVFLHQSNSIETIIRG